MPARFRLGFLTHVEGRGDAASTYRNAQELFVVADELGFDVGWVAQHHISLPAAGSPRLGHSSGLAVLTRALAGEEVGTPGFRIQPPAKDLCDRIWQGVFSAQGAMYAARSGSNLLLNRATYGYEEPTDVVQRPWADGYLQDWTAPREPRIGLSRMVFPAKDKDAALAQIGPGVLAGAAKFVERGQFPAGLTLEEYLTRFHSFYVLPGRRALCRP